MSLPRLRQLLSNREFEAVLAELNDFTPVSAFDRAATLVIRTEAMLAMGQYDRSSIDEAIELLLALHDIELLPQAKYLRAHLLLMSAELAAAREELSEAYYGFKRIGDFRGMGRTANWLAHIFHQTAEYSLSLEYNERARRHFETGGFTLQVGMSIYNMEVTCLRAGFLRRAVQLHTTVSTNYAHLFTPEHIYNSHHTNALVAAQLGDHQWAQEEIFFTSTLNPSLRREYFRQLEISGYVYTLAGEYDKAEQFLVDGEKLAYEIAPESTLVSQIKRLFGDLYVLTRKFDLAEKYTLEGLAVAEKINERLEIAACYRVLAQVEAHRHNDYKARDWFKKAIDLFGLISARYELAVTRYLAALTGLHEQHERVALLYLAREYFESEQVAPYIQKVNAELAKANGPVTIARRPSGEKGASRVIAASDAMKKIIEKVAYIAPSDMNVLLTGETGTGKDLLAAFIHEQSGRTGRFVAVNVAALPTELMESELFGHSRGAFTNARTEKPGLMHEADQGTLFLNEIGEASPELQAKLLQVLETRRVRRLGETAEQAVNFRLIAATNQDLMERIREGKFRSDLYHRLNQAPIELAPLDDRADDIAALVPYFLKAEGCRIEQANGELAELIKILSQRSWPGNVRQLGSVIKRLWMESGNDIGRMVRLAFGENQNLCDPDDLMAMLAESGGNQRKAARQMGISESTLRYRLKKRGE